MKTFDHSLTLATNPAQTPQFSWGSQSHPFKKS